jgi:GH25 family lysozyme M1 (1,4-beta-N-acetylmuramidase)
VTRGGRSRPGRFLIDDEHQQETAMRGSTRGVWAQWCGVGLLGLAFATPAPGQDQGPGAAGHALQEELRRLQEQQARAEEEARLRGVPLVTVTASDPNAAEPDDPGEFTVTRSGVLAGRLVVHYVVRGNAENGVDFERLPGSVEIPDGEATVKIPVRVLNDSVPEPVERVLLEIVPDPAYVVGVPSAALVRISDDDGGLAPSALAPTVSPRQAVDVSHWSGSGWGAGCFVDNGITHMIAGTQNPAITRAQLDAALEAGMTVDAYVYLYWDYGITAQVQNALATIAGYPVTRLWLDAEDSAAGYSSAQMLQKIQEALDACGAMPCGIYTAKWWWDPATYYSTAFGDVPLWYARYDFTPDFNDWYGGVSGFGGWNDPVGKQYQGTTYVCGVNVDRDIMLVGAAPVAAFKGETGRVTASQTDAGAWHSVALENAYVAPVVIMQPPSFNGGDPTTVRIRNVSPRGFEWQMDEWDYRDGAHTTETVSYVVMESGAFRLEDGTRVEVGTVSAADSFTPVTFRQAFAETPVILSQAQTVADPAAVVTRQHSASASGFELRLQEQEANDPAHGLETVGWIAIEPGVGMTAGIPFEAATTPDAVTQDWYALQFAQVYGDPVLVASVETFDGGDTVGLRHRNLGPTGAEVFLEEEQSRDAEVAHTTEVVGYLVFDHPGSLVDLGGGANPPPAPAGLKPDGGQVFANGSSVSMSSSPVSGATGYEFSIEHSSGGAWASYYTYSASTSSFTFWPQYRDREYRFRMRAQNAHGWGPWSAWASFTVGTVGSTLPLAPTGLSPDAGRVYAAGAGVVMSCSPVTGATSYEFSIEYAPSGAWAPYYAYTGTGSSRTFYPVYHGSDYRFRVRAQNAYGWGPYSAWATFHVNP